MTPKFKEGQLVCVIKNIEKNRHREDPGLSSDMKEYEGKEFVINFVLNDRNHVWYTLDGVPWTWDETWLVLAEAKMTDIKDSDLMGVFADET